MASRPFLLSRLLSGFLAAACVFSPPAAHAAKVAEDILHFSSQNIDSVLQYYARLKNVYNEGGLQRMVQVSSVLRKEDPRFLKKVFRRIERLPDLLRRGHEIEAILESKVIAKISVPLLEKGILEINGARVLIRHGISIQDIYGTGDLTSASKTLLTFLFPTAHAAEVGGDYAGVIKLLQGLMASFFGAKAANAQQEQAAESARQTAYQSGGPLGLDTIFGPDNAPVYHQRDGGNYAFPDTNVSDELTDAAMTKYKDYLKANPNKCNVDFNSLVLDNIKKITAENQGKGYSVTSGGFNIPLSLGAHKMAAGKSALSHCTTATYTAFTKTLDSALGACEPKVLLGPQQASHFQTGKNDNYGVWGIWNNDYGGAGDTAGYLNKLTGANYGQSVTDPQEACPGDFVKFDRKSGPGHSVVFLGYTGSGEDKKFCYWSSNKGTNGYGTQCEKITRIKRYSILKVKDACAVGKIPADRPYSAGDKELNGTALYSGQYTKSTPQADADADRFHTTIATQANPSPIPAAPPPSPNEAHQRH